MTLTEIIGNDIRRWLESTTEFFTNERDLQVRLAVFLMTQRNYRVHTEYRIPLAELKAKGLPVENNTKLAKGRAPDPVFPWNNQMSVDIVVEKDGRFVAIELKYATRKIDCKETIFGEEKLTDANILKDQAASNLVMYNYWKDVRRLEILSSVYFNVEGGVALIVTNSRDFWNQPNIGANYEAFSLHERNAVGPGLLKWTTRTADSIIASHPQFRLAHAYQCRWADTGILAKSLRGEKFRYMISTITI